MSDSKSPPKLGRRIMKYLGILLSFGVVIGVSLWESSERTSPGELHPSHAFINSLQGKTGCAACHGGVLQSMGNACLECHNAIDEQLKMHSGLHGALDKNEAERCAACHVEHTGGTTQLVSERSFILANVNAPSNYSHQTISAFKLVEKHENLECAKCHENAEADRLKPGERRFLGLQQTCSECHEDTHKGTFGNDCAACHGQTHPFTEAALFTHTETFSLVGGHADQACASCHKESGNYSVAKLIENKTDSRTCTECHSSPHRSEFLQAFTKLQNVGEGNSCQQCHDAAHETFRLPKAKMSEAFHAATGFTLDAPHTSLKCAECHEEQSENNVLSTDSFSGILSKLDVARSPNDCRTCHIDPHQGDFNSGFSKGECLVCHTAGHFTPSKFDTALHKKTNFVLDGSHVPLKCNSCHESITLSGRFSQKKSSCIDCHTDAHRGRLKTLAQSKSSDKSSDCAHCHSTKAFSGVKWKVSDHDQWTRFKLQGAHARAECIACHLPSQKSDKNHRSFGFAEMSCSACHLDIHVGQFNQGGVTDCGTCHDNSVAWKPIRFDHDQDSRFALDQDHESLECASCHQNVVLKNGRKTVRYKPLEIKCAGCHGFK